MIFWGFIRLASVVATIINPEAGASMQTIVKGVDEIAMINVLAYTSNSVSEKLGIGYFNYKSRVAKIEAGLDNDDDDEEVDNG